jgi:hypothetical protein
MIHIPILQRMIIFFAQRFAATDSRTTQATCIPRSPEPEPAGMCRNIHGGDCHAALGERMKKRYANAPR